MKTEQPFRSVEPEGIYEASLGPLERPAKYAFELGGGMSVRQADGIWRKYAKDQLPAAFEAIRKLRDTLIPRDDRAVRAAFFPKAKNRKCVG